MLFTISNFISFFRLLLSIPMWYLLSNNMNLEAFILGLFAVFTDLTDGYIARKMNQISEYGKIIDPVADKVFVGVTAIALVIRHSLPLWFVIAILARDLIIMLAGLYASTKIKLVIPSNYVGKATVIVISFVMAAALLEYPLIVSIGKYFALFMMILSLFVYGKGMFETLKASEK